MLLRTLLSLVAVSATSPAAAFRGATAAPAAAGGNSGTEHLNLLGLDAWVEDPSTKVFGSTTRPNGGATDREQESGTANRRLGLSNLTIDQAPRETAPVALGAARSQHVQFQIALRPAPGGSALHTLAVRCPVHSKPGHQLPCGF
eukprot:SAG31_NODE_5343_length_2596_cov_4.210653_2_plen_145_part_00